MNDFDSRAASWDEDPGRRERADAIAAAIRAHVPGDQIHDALEYGCGTGILSFTLGEWLPRCVLADTSEAMLDQVRAKLAAASPRMAGWEVQNLDLSTQDGPRCEFDLAFSALALHHIEHVGPALRRFRTALRPGGWLALCDLDADPDGGYHHPHGGVTPPKHFHNGFTRDDLASALGACGFQVQGFTTPWVDSRLADGELRDFPLFLVVARAR